MKFTTLYPSMTIHRAGCVDIKRDMRSLEVQNDLAVDSEHDTWQEAVTSECDGELREMGWTEDHFTVKPCAKRG